MRTFKASRAQQRLWALLTVAFVIVGLSAGAALLKLSIDRYETDYRRELKSLASVAALAIDSNAHEALKRPSQMTSPLYQREVGKLAEIQSQLKDIRYIYTIASNDAGYVFVLDPTPPGDHDFDGVENKSFLGDPYPEITSAAKSCFARGTPTVESEPTTDRWGTFISAYAPIFGKSGQVIGVLGIDRHANDIAEHQRDLKNVVAGGVLLVLTAGIFFGWIFSRKMAASTENRGWLRYVAGSNLIFRATILEVLLGCLALAVFLGAMQNLSMQGRLTASIRESYDEAQKLSEIQTFAATEEASLDRVRQLAEMARRGNLPWVYERMIHAQSLDSSVQRRQVLKAAAEELEVRISRTREEQAANQVKLEETQRSLAVIFFVSAFLALGALMVVRAASLQQQDLVAAKTDSEWHQVAYRQVVENLPIGLFMVTDGKINFSNHIWDAQSERRPDQDRLAGLTRWMSDADAYAFAEALRQAEASREPFETQYRLLRPGGATSIYEARGVPLLNAQGAYECLLGFTVDVTQRVRSQEILKGKNREVQSKNRMLSRAVALLEDNFEAMIQTLVKAVEAKDIYTAGHSERVMRYSLAIGRTLKLSAADLKTLEMGTLIHDIGKIGIPDEILTKPDALSDEEYQLVKGHAVSGAKMVERVPVFAECVPIIRWHHERMNGSGYPDGLKGDEIPLLVRVASVADVFDAMTSNRAYRAAMTFPEAVGALRSMAIAGELDPELVEILAEIVLGDGVLGFKEPSRAA